MPHSPNHDFECGRRLPAQGGRETSDGRTILFCTVCTKDRARWLAAPEVGAALTAIWLHDARAWIVGRWLLMPDHAHFFCTPSADGKHSIERWVEYWKDLLAKRLGHGPGKWQRGIFHHRIRSAEQYGEKVEYLRQNPVRAGLVERPEDWLQQGELTVISWDQ